MGQITKILLNTSLSPNEQQIFNGVYSAVGGVGDFLMIIWTQIACPLISVILLISLAITFSKAGLNASKMKETFEANMFAVILQLVCLTVTLSFSVWGYIMLGGA